MSEVNGKEAIGLYQKHRPKTLDKVVGQSRAIKQINSWFKSGKVPHAICFAGQTSGIGKTTLARIVARKLGCDISNRGLDFVEINAASDRGIDMTRRLQQQVKPPLMSPCRVWILDECHRLSNDAQSSLLKTLEDIPHYAYFMLCTTDPSKLLKTIQTRCTFVELVPVDKQDLSRLVTRVAEAEEGKISDAVLKKLIQTADGSPRRALVLLDDVLKLEDEEGRLAAVESPELEKQSFDLVRAMLYEQTKFGPVAEILKKLENLESEDIRRHVLACARTELLKDGKNVGRAFLILECFQGYSDSGKAGHAWLARAAYEVVTSAR